MGELTTAYAGVRARIRETVATASAPDLDAPALACPGWRARDVAAHLVGALADLMSGTFDGNISDEWTAGHVRARDGVPITDVLDEWDRIAGAMEGGLDALPSPFGRIVVADAVTHEHDLLGALGRCRPADRDADVLAFATFGAGVRRRVRSAAMRTLLLAPTDGGDPFVAGEGDPAATVRATRFELTRAMAGRRSPEQMAAYDWEGDAAAYLPLIPAFGPRVEPLVEEQRR